MNGRRRVLAGVLALGMAAGACGREAPPGQTGSAAQSGAPPDQEPPVALNGDSPIQYPPRLYEQKVEGDVVLRLFVDSSGRLLAESSRVAESSGYPALDSAALAGARKLRFAPGRRHGLPVATAFLQPIEFRHPAASGAVMKGAPDSAAPRRAVVSPPAAPSVPAPAPARRTQPDTNRPRLDTTRAQPESTPARPDTGASAH